MKINIKFFMYLMNIDNIRIVHSFHIDKIYFNYINHKSYHMICPIYSMQLIQVYFIYLRAHQYQC